MLPLVVAVLFGILVVAVVACGLGAREGTRWGLLAGLAVVAFPRFIISVADEQSDVPLALYFALASVLLAAGSRREIWVAGFAAGLGMWTKNEGSLYAAALLAAFLFRRRDLRGGLIFALGALPLAALLVWFKWTLAPPNDLAAFSARGGVLRNAVDLRRWAELLYETLRRLVYFQQFGLWLVAAVAAALVFARRRPLSEVALALLISCAAFAAIYVLQDAQQVHWLFRTSADRLVVQMWPALIVAAIPALRASG
jgi:Dolichyl-phosphate-mannose-protein mannosyltransferase